MHRLLVLVDLQEDFLSRSGLAPHRERLVDRASALLDGFRENGDPVLHVRTCVFKNPDNRMPHWKAEGRWICLEASEGYLPPEVLKETEDEPIVHKNGFAAPDLLDRVYDIAPDIVIICGVMLHACIRQAVLQLHENGVQVVVADDAVGSDDPVHAAITRRYLQDRGVTFQSVAALSGGGKEASPGDSIDTEITILSKAALPWESAHLAERMRFIPALAEFLRESAVEIADRMASDIGKPIRFGRTEVERSAEMVSAIATRLSESPFEIREGPTIVRRRAHGTVAILTPWNNPIYIPLGKIVPALLCGNTVAWKPASEVQSLSEWLLDSMREAGLPENVLRITPGGVAEGRNLVRNPAIDAVSLTGSQATGYSVGEICAWRSIPFQAELGGNNAAIVWTDADLPEAAKKITAGAFEMGGQRCTANRRVIVSKDIAEAFMHELIEAASQLRWGNPSNGQTQIGPLIDHRSADAVERCLGRAEAGDFRLHFPLGRSPQESENAPLPWSAPCIVECDDPTHELVQEEMFAPVLVFQRANDWNHALELANRVRQGLVSALFSDNPERISDFLAKAWAGILKINASTADAAIDIPFGGWKGSGTGPPEHGDGDLEFYTRSQTRYGAV